MSRVYYVTLLAALVLALLAPLSLAGAQPPPPLPARLLMDPPTQAELAAQAGLRPAGRDSRERCHGTRRPRRSPR